MERKRQERFDKKNYKVGYPSRNEGGGRGGVVHIIRTYKVGTELKTLF